MDLLCFYKHYFKIKTYLDIIFPNFRFRTNRTTVTPTEMRMSPAYQHYYMYWFRAISQAFIPFVLMAFLNGRIIFKMRQTKNAFGDATRVSELII